MDLGLLVIVSTKEHILHVLLLSPVVSNRSQMHMSESAFVIFTLSRTGFKYWEEGSGAKNKCILLPFPECGSILSKFFFYLLFECLLLLLLFVKW